MYGVDAGHTCSKHWTRYSHLLLTYRSRAMPLLAIAMTMMGIVVFFSTRTMPLFVSGFIHNVPVAKK